MDNNTKYNCPPRMSDGRHYTSYNPRCYTNFFALPEPLSSYDYRMYLTANAEKIIEANRAEAQKLNACAPCDKNVGLPEQTIQVCDGRKCAFPVNEPTGLGLGRKQHTDNKPGFSPNDAVKAWGAPLV